MPLISKKSVVQQRECLLSDALISAVKQKR